MTNAKKNSLKNSEDIFIVLNEVHACIYTVSLSSKRDKMWTEQRLKSIIVLKDVTV